MSLLGAPRVGYLESLGVAYLEVDGDNDEARVDKQQEHAVAAQDN